MPILIDGWNLIRDRASDIRDDDCDALESARYLISYLRQFQESHADPIILVFDSRNEYLDIFYENSTKLMIVPSKNADKYIKRYIENTPEKQRRNLRVISSDNEIYFHAKSYYAIPIKCGDFWKKIRGR